jgi:GT2 family glycosyltransferase
VQRVTVVVATRDRRGALLHTLDRLAHLDGPPPVIVVDNGSADGSSGAVRAAHPWVDVVELRSNRGAVARNLGVQRATTPYVAFADDDSWWAPDALERAADILDGSPEVGLIAGRVLVGPAERLDDTCAEMLASPLLGSRPGVPGTPVLGFLACAAVVRRAAFLAVGGFDDLLFFFGEEALLAMDLAAAGWALQYVEGVVAHHHPSAPSDPGARRTRQLRNDLLVTWMRRPLPTAARRTLELLRAARCEPTARRALLEALARAPRALARRRAMPLAVEEMLARLDQARSQPGR